MTHKHPSEHEQKQILRTCPACDAKPFDWCKTKRGNYSLYLHSRRPS